MHHVIIDITTIHCCPDCHVIMAAGDVIRVVAIAMIAAAITAATITAATATAATATAATTAATATVLLSCRWRV